MGQCDCIVSQTLLYGDKKIMRKTQRVLNQSLLSLLEESESTLCQRHGIPATTYARWKASLQTALSQSELAEENQRLRQILGEREAEILELKELAGRRW